MLFKNLRSGNIIEVRNKDVADMMLRSPNYAVIEPRVPDIPAPNDPVEPIVAPKGKKGARRAE